MDPKGREESRTVSLCSYDLSQADVDAAVALLHKAASDFRPTHAEVRLYWTLQAALVAATVGVFSTAVGLELVNYEVAGGLALFALGVLLTSIAALTVVPLLILNARLIAAVFRHHRSLTKIGFHAAPASVRLSERLAALIPIVAAASFAALAMRAWYQARQAVDGGVWLTIVGATLLLLASAIALTRVLQQKMRDLAIARDAERLRRELASIRPMGAGESHLAVPATLVQAAAAIESDHISYERAEALSQKTKVAGYAVLLQGAAAERRLSLPAAARLEVDSLTDSLTLDPRRVDSSLGSAGLRTALTESGHVAVSYRIDESERRVVIAGIRDVTGNRAQPGTQE